MGLETATIAWIGVGLSAAGTGASVYQSEQQKKDAKSKEKEQKKQADMEKRVAAAQTRRENRVRSAQLESTTQGIEGSIVSAPLQSGETATEHQIQLNEEQTASQKKQYGIERSQVVGQANANIASSIGTFASTALTADYKGEG